ncbi:ribonuclease HI [Novosphingobium aquiterrae]|uniref:Ribonuclease HI n=1 Tax=Novosphingobium aquiterrae TaxID=624388 RepID=A0ABV6PEN1_9SPHN
MVIPRTSRRLKVFFDGGCRPNPGRIEAAVVVRGVTSYFNDLGHGTNSDAEWQALLCAVQVARSQDFTDIDLVGDAIEVVEQARKALRDGNADHPKAAAFLTSAAQISTLRVRWIKRQQNLAGIALAARHPR